MKPVVWGLEAVWARVFPGSRQLVTDVTWEGQFTGCPHSLFEKLGNCYCLHFWETSLLFGYVYFFER